MSVTTPPRAVRVARVAFIALGTVLVGVAVAALVAGVPFGQWGAILIWLVCAVLLHDAVFAPLVLVGSRLLHRIGARVSWAQIGVVQVALVIGGAITLVAFPGIRSQSLGTRNPTVLVFPYALHLAVAWAAIGVVTAAVVLVIGARRRRRSPSV